MPTNPTTTSQPSSSQRFLVPVLLAVIAALLLGIFVVLIVQGTKSSPSPTAPAAGSPPPLAAAPQPTPGQPAPAPTPTDGAAPSPVNPTPAAAPEPASASSGNAAVAPAPDAASPAPAAPANAVVAAHRSPLPQPGETFTKAIPPTVLGGRAASASASASTTTNPAAAGVIPWSSAAQYSGKKQTITIEGKVVDTGLSRTGVPVFFNFSKDRKDLSVAIFQTALPGLLPNPDKAYLNKTVRVTGEVEDYRGRPEMKVNKADQIKVID